MWNLLPFIGNKKVCVLLNITLLLYFLSIIINKLIWLRSEIILTIINLLSSLLLLCQWLLINLRLWQKVWLSLTFELTLQILLSVWYFFYFWRFSLNKYLWLFMSIIPYSTHITYKTFLHIQHLIISNNNHLSHRTIDWVQIVINLSKL